MVARSNTVAGWEGSTEIRVDKKNLKVEGQQPKKKKVDYGAYNVGLRQGRELDEKKCLPSSYGQNGQAVDYTKIGNPTVTESQTVPSPEKAPHQNL
jgi:hypothetical protein